MYVKHTKNRSNAKVNFIDENDVFVGFNMSGDCCEIFGYILTDDDRFQSSYSILYTEEGGDSGIRTDNDSDYNLEGYVFDTTWFEEREQIVVFKLIKDNEPTIFLTLFNSHNGWYRHGFEFQNGTDVIHESSI